MPYDKDSGLVYTERTVRAGWKVCRQHDPSFAIAHVGITKRVKPQGRRTLQQQATRQLLANLDRLDEYSFSTLPEAWVKTIYEKIFNAKLLTPNVWKLFSQSVIRTRYKWNVACSCKPLSYYVEVLNSPSMTWLSSIRLKGEAWEESHLAPLCYLDNLQSLHIESINYSRKDCLTDRLIRQWLQQISAKDNWKHFRLLTARGQKLLTPHGLQLLSQLRSMDVMILDDCGVMSKHIHDGLINGWRRYMQASPDHASFLDQSLSDVQLLSILPVSNIAERPCIEACIGFNEMMYRRGVDPFDSQELVFIRDRSATAASPAPTASSMQAERSTKRVRLKDTSKKQTGYLDMISSIQS